MKHFKLFFLVPTLFASSTWATQIRQSDKLWLNENVSEVLLGAGGEVHAQFSSTSDVFLAGGQLDCKVKTAQNAFIAGGNITIDQSQFKDLVTAGGHVGISGTAIEQNLILAGGDIHVDANVNGEVIMAGGQVTLRGHFKKSVLVYSGNLTIEPDTVIDGDLNYAAKRFDISPSAKILGAKNFVETKRRGPAGRIWAILVGLGIILLCWLIAKRFENTAGVVFGLVKVRFWEMLGKGLALILVGIPVLFACFVTGLGAPLAILLFLIFILVSVVSSAFLIYGAGAQIQIWLKRKKPKHSFLVGVLGLVVLACIPILGFIALTILKLVFFGALASLIWQGRRKLD